MNTFITVITSTYNTAKTLQKCIDSVQKQTFPNVEHIIIDGASTDGTADIIKANAEEPGSRISFWLSEPDIGIYDAWNKALPHIHGEWVLFLGADDWLYSNGVLTQMVEFLHNAYPQYIIVYGKKMFHYLNGHEVIFGEPWERIKRQFETRGQIPHPATFHHHSVFNGNYFDNTYRITGDYEFLSRLWSLDNNINKVLSVNVIVTYMNEGGCSSSNIATVIKENAHTAYTIYGIKYNKIDYILFYLRGKLSFYVMNKFGYHIHYLCHKIITFFSGNN